MLQNWRLGPERSLSEVGIPPYHYSDTPHRLVACNMHTKTHIWDGIEKTREVERRKWVGGARHPERRRHVEVA